MTLLLLTSSIVVVLKSLADTDRIPFRLPAPSEVSKLRSAIIYTELGELHFELYPQIAPWHVSNFKYRADNGLYKNTRFHLYKPFYLVQGGAKGKGSAGYSLPPEFSEKKHEPGTLGMARVPDQSNPARESHGSQFYISLGFPNHLNKGYTVFGQLTKGMETLKRLRKNDLIYDIKVFVRP